MLYAVGDVHGIDAAAAASGKRFSRMIRSCFSACLTASSISHLQQRSASDGVELGRVVRLSDAQAKNQPSRLGPRGLVARCSRVVASRPAKRERADS